MSLGFRLLLLVLIAAVPVLAVQVVDQLNEREEHRQEIATDAQRLAALFSEQLSQVVAAARGLAVSTAQMPEVRSRAAEACVARLRELMQRFPEFVGIGAVGPDGTSFCRTSEGPVIDISDRPYFQEALSERRFTASGYMIGRSIQRPSVVFAAPSFDDGGEVSAVVVVAYDLANLSDVLAPASLPEGASASLIDADGIMVARLPATEGAVGSQVRSSAMMETIRAQGRGAMTAEGVDGVERVYGFAPLVEPARFYAMVGLPLAPALAAIDGRLWRNLGMLGGIFALAALTALVGGEMAIRRPLGQLEKQARRLAAGDLAARSHLDSGAIGEVGALAASLDDMAQAIADRQTALAASEELNRRILDSSRDCIKVIGFDGRLQSINACGSRILEIDDAGAVIGASYLDFWRDEDRAAAEAAIAEALASGAGRFIGFYRTPSGHETWWDEVVTPMCDAAGRPERLLVVSRDITEIKQAEEQRESLLAELDHRVKNSLAAIQSIAVQTLKPGEDVAAFTGRLETMAKAHNLLSKSRWQGAELSGLLRTMLAAYGERVALSGPPVRLEPKMTQTLGMAVHELATNAAKHGALSEPAGEVALAWRLEGEGERRLVIEWQERGGPPAAAPERRGFGLTFIERSLSHEFGGVVETDFRREGLHCRIDLGLGRGSASGFAAEAVTPAAPPEAQAASLVGRRILLVEDEALAAMEMEAVLRDAGCEVVGPAARLDRAMSLAEAGGFDAAALDVNLDGEFVFPLAEKLRADGVPFVFMTGYNSRGVFPPAFQDVARVGKPVQERALTAALAEAIAAAEPEPSRKTA